MPPALSFAVRRSEPVLVGPARPTPRETKLLSDIDYTESPWSYMAAIFVYRAGQPELADPVSVIRRALSEALVHYYPLAGRIREVLGCRGLTVDCTGEGAMFAEAEANVRLKELEAAGLGLPFPCDMEQLQINMDGVTSALDYPMVLLQVTRLVCGGFIVGARLCHNVCDGQGFAQFLTAIADMARGLPSPVISPAWSRKVLTMSRERLSVPKPAPPTRQSFTHDDMMIRSFFFGPTDIAALKRNLPPTGQHGATIYEVLAASVWMARTAAIALPPGEHTALTVVANFRRNAALRLPNGYYGNACAPLRVVAPVDVLTQGSLQVAVELVQKAKATASHVRSASDVLRLHGPPPLPSTKMFLVSDLRHLGFHCLDFGWGEPLYGGPAEVMFWETFLVAVKNSDGEDQVALPVALSRPAMERFRMEMNKLLKNSDMEDEVALTTPAMEHFPTETNTLLKD